jgi:hypothetical protein
VASGRKNEQGFIRQKYSCNESEASIFFAVNMLDLAIRAEVDNFAG